MSAELFIGGVLPKKIKDFYSEIFEIIQIPELKINTPVRTHLDIQLYYGKTATVCEPTVYDFWKKHIPNVIKGKAAVSDKYPLDISYNAFEVCGTIICNKAHTDSILLNRFSKSVTVKQGYAKCSTVTVTDSAVITSDRGIATACKNSGADTLIVGNEGIILPGYDCGFIGGASAVDKNRVYFFGDISMHPDFGIIKDFINKHGKDMVFVQGEPLTDYGSPVIIYNRNE